MINETDYTNNPLTKEQENQIDALFAQYDRNDAPGCAVGVIQDGRFIYKKSFGMANLDYDIPITADSKFELASTSKQFTAACIAFLYIDGKLDLEDDVRKYIPEMPDYGNIIKIKHLLYHTSGLRDYHILDFLSGNRTLNYLSMKKAFKFICQQTKLNFQPGEKHQYTNSGYLLLAEIVARISNKKFSEYIQDNIFTPLNMVNTIIEDSVLQIIKNKASGYHKTDDLKYSKAYHNYDCIGGKSVISTINDLLLWDNNFYTGKLGGKKFLDLMQSEGLLNNNEKVKYGFGLEFLDYKNIPVIMHDGGLYGFTTLYSRFPEHKLSIIILNNNDDDENDNKGNQIADILLKEEIMAITSNKPLKSEIRATEFKTVQVTERELEKFCGCYWCEEDRLNRKIYLKDGSLYFWRNERSESKLIPINQNEFAIESKTAIVKFVFELNLNSKTINFIENDKCTSVFKSYDPIESSLEYLNRYTGNFYSEDLGIVYQLVTESDKLCVFINDEKFLEFEAVIPNLVKVVDWNCYLAFEVNGQNEINGFRLDTMRVQNIEFIKQS